MTDQTTPAQDGSIVARGDRSPASYGAPQLRHIAPAAPAHPTGRPVVVVLGMHRSGTSLLSHMLHVLGADMADETDHVSAKNPGGFWERPALNALQDEALAAIGRPLDLAGHVLPFPAGWWRGKAVQPVKRKLVEYLQGELAKSQALWGFKDPRTCRLLPLWKEVFAELGLSPRYVVAVRGPGSAAVSMANKNPAARTLSVLQGELMWLAYNYDVMRHVAAGPLTLVDYEDWFSDGVEVADRLSRALGLPQTFAPSELARCVDEIVRPDYRHEREGEGRATVALPVSMPFYDTLRAIGVAGEPDLPRLDRQLATLDLIFDCLAPTLDSVGRLPPLERAHQALTKTLEQAERRVAKLEAALATSREEASRLAAEVATLGEAARRAEGLEDQLREAQTRLADAEQGAEAARGNAERLEQAAADLEGRNRSLEAERDALRAQTTALLGERDAAREETRLEQATAAASAVRLEQALAEERARAEQAETTARAVELRVKTLETQLAAAQNGLAQALAEAREAARLQAQDAAAAIDRFEQALAAERARADQALADTSAVDRLKAELAALRETLRRERETFAEARAAARALETASR